MQESIANKSPRRRIARRVAAAGMALATALVLGACRAEGGGYVGDPFPGGPVGVYQGDANFGFNFTCEMDRRARRAVIKGVITYHDSASSTVGGSIFPAIRLNGTVDPFFVENVSTCEQAAEVFPATAQFEGTYRPQDKTIRALKGEFIVEVFDQGEPARPGGDFTGDSFAIELIGGAYNGYTRGGYIEGGNIQVRG